MQKHHRDIQLSNELHYVILRLIQLREEYHKKGSGVRIDSVKYRGRELTAFPGITELDLAKLDFETAKLYARKAGYIRKRNIEKLAVVSKIDVIINERNTSIRCLNYTDRPLVNHSTRRKYESVCNHIGLPIEPLDKMVERYWLYRKMKVFNEDCYPYSSLNPFLTERKYLTELLSFMAFHSFDYQKAGTSGFVVEDIHQILDFVDPRDESTWKIYTPASYMNDVWNCLCFSMRDRKGMPSDEDLFEPENADIRKWVCEMEGRYKGALHIRVKKFDSFEYKRDFESQFEYIHRDELRDVNINKGELDEYLIKLFLVECREKKLPVPLGKQVVEVCSVGDLDHEYLVPRVSVPWSEQESKFIVFICNEIHAGKSKSGDKADVYINHIGVSVKSRRGAAPTIINQTSRDKILRVMNSLRQPIAPLDRIVDRYWSFRLNGGTEDVSNETSPLNPFCVDENGCSNLDYLKPLLNYFAFRGSGTKDSRSPAKYVLSIGSPDDISTWVYYDEDNFVEEHWDKFIFSLRSHGMPKKITDEMIPWIRMVNGRKKGLLNVRIKSL